MSLRAVASDGGEQVSLFLVPISSPDKPHREGRHSATAAVQRVVHGLNDQTDGDFTSARNAMLARRRLCGAHERTQRDVVTTGSSSRGRPSAYRRTHHLK